MEAHIDVKPLPYKTRQRTFGFLFIVFFVSLPFLYLYATGYRFDLERPTNLVSTGGIYLAVERSGAEIFIDNELVRETRTFRKAFYAQSLDVGTHRVHVQKEGYHTWVKELPVSKRLVTEAEAFNFPLVPQVRVISPWQTATGSMVVADFKIQASSTNILLATTTKATSTFIRNQEFVTLLPRFASSTIQEAITEETRVEKLKELLRGSTTTIQEDTSNATSTIVSGGVKLFLSGDDVFASWIDTFEQMPYYYCAPDFSAYTGSSTPMDVLIEEGLLPAEEVVVEEEEGIVVHPVQTIPKDTVCDPTIRMDRRSQEVQDFDFLPGSTDFVIMVLGDGVYVVEVDDRSWQNVQPLILGEKFRLHIENGNIFVYDGTLIYQVVVTTE